MTAALLWSTLRSTLPSSWLPPALLPTSANTSSLLFQKAAGSPQRKSSAVRSVEDLDLVQDGETFPPFPFPSLSRRGSAVELELDNGGGQQRQSKGRWSTRRLANTVYIASFWLLIVYWLRTLAGYGYDEVDAAGRTTAPT